MNMRFYCFLFLMILGNDLFAQNNLLIKADTLNWYNGLDTIAEKRNKINKTNLTILGAWASVNILQSAIAATNAKDADKAFFKMNAYFNAVNLAIAGIGLYGVKKAMQKKITLKQNIKEQEIIEKILLFNTGLDVGYVFAGLYLNEKGQRQNNKQTEGYGRSIAFQGAFLLGFDIVQYFLHKHNGKPLKKAIDKLDFTTTNNGIGLVYKL